MGSLQAALYGVFALCVGCSSGMRVSPSAKPDGGGTGRDAPPGASDGGPDGNDVKSGVPTFRSDVMTDGLVRDVVADQREPVPCKGTLVLGTSWPLAGTGALPTSLAMVDLNGDGKLDLATANYVDPSKGPGTVSVILGKGDGTFAAKVDYPTGAGPYAVAVGDVNGDHNLDLVTANYASDTASVLLGNGDGTFSASLDDATGKAPAAVALADLNGDGKLDLVATSSTSATVGVLLGNGDGTFSTRVDHAVGSSPYGVVTGDLNGDGKPDLAVVNEGSATVSVLLGNGDGGFAGNVDYSVKPANGYYNGFGPTAVALGDLNSDGNLDLVVADKYSGTASVLLGLGDGTFAATQDAQFGPSFSPEDYPTGNYATWVALADLNLDGKLDLVSANDLGTASVLLGMGDGTFADSVRYPAGSEPLSVAVGDLNGDGEPDLAIADYGLSAVNVLLATGDGEFPADPSNYYYSADSVALGDLNGDGRLDLVASANSNVLVHVQLAAEGGGFTDPVDYTLTTYPTSVVLGDLNADGRPDVVVGTWTWTSAGVSVLLGKGDGTFADPVDCATGDYAVESVAVGDLNGDGRPDLVTANNADSSTVSVFLATGNAKFAAKQDYWTGSPAFSSALADLNGDGKLDIAVAGYDTDVVSVLLGIGDGKFAAPQDHPTGDHPNAVAVVDLDGDGKLDLITANSYTDTVSVLLGAGDGTFSAKVDYATGIGPKSVVAGDMNGDGRLDLITANGSMVSVLLGNGDGTFATRFDYAAGGSALAIADLNGDGRPDLVVGGWPILSACR